MPSIIYFLIGLLPTFVLKALHHREAMSQQRSKSVFWHKYITFIHKTWYIKTDIIVILNYTKDDIYDEQMDFHVIMATVIIYKWIL